MPWETELFNLGEVVVTDKRFTVRQQSFSLESIFGVQVVYHARTWFPVLAPLLAAFVFVCSAIRLTQPAYHLAALAFTVTTFALFWTGGPSYTIALETEQGHIEPLTSTDRFFVESISQVLYYAVHSESEKSLGRYPSSRRPPLRIVAGKQLPAVEPISKAPEYARKQSGRGRLFSMGNRTATKTAG
jgi:hypothetical protein